MSNASSATSLPFYKSAAETKKEFFFRLFPGNQKKNKDPDESERKVKQSTEKFNSNEIMDNIKEKQHG